jgi:hypothetical protein
VVDCGSSEVDGEAEPVTYNPVDYMDLQKSMTNMSAPEDIFSAVEEMRSLTAQIPVMAKAQNPMEGVARGGPAHGPKAVFFDPLSLQYSLGYKDRRYSLTYDTLKRIAHQVAIVGAIINTRIAQVSSFAEPYRLSKSLGFRIKHKSPDHETTDAEREFIEKIEAFVLDCGEPGKQNPFTNMKRSKFEGFIKKIVRDTLTYDQLGFEVVPRRNKIPFEFWAADGATLRIASPDQDAGMHFSYHHRNPISQNLIAPHRFDNLYIGQQYGNRDALPGKSVRYVQVVNGQIENVYSDELAFGVRNPRSDIYIQGYGFGELEQLITIITSILYAEEYNRRFFSQGAHPKGLLNFKGDNWTPDQLEAFKRQWVAQVSGTENAWKTPITQSEGIEWVDLQRSNQEMGFQGWLEYLIKITCGVYLIDPAEINFDLHGGVQQTPLFESSQEWKLKASRDRGLKPLLRFLASLINEYVIDKIDDHFMFEFAGLDDLTEQEKHELLKEQISSYKTLNEGRREMDLAEIPGGIGDIPQNPATIQILQLQQQREDQLRQEQQQAAEGEQQVPEEQPPPTPKEEQEVRHQEDKHPLELEKLKQEVQQGAMALAAPPEEAAPGEAPPEGAPPEGAAPPAEGAPPQGAEPVETQPSRPEGDPRKQYAALFGKSVTMDDFIDFMRSRK